MAKKRKVTPVCSTAARVLGSKKPVSTKSQMKKKSNAGRTLAKKCK